MSQLSKKIIAIAATVLFVAVTALCIVIRINNSKIPEGTVGALAGNIYNDGLFCEADGKVYFSNSYDGGALYVMDPDRTNVKLVKSISARFINVGGNSIFFFGKPLATEKGLGVIVSKPGIFTVTKNGKNFKALSKDKSQSMLLVDNQIFYQHYTEKEHSTLYCLDLVKHENNKVLSYLINPASYYGGYIYYNGMYDDHYLHTLDTKTGETATVWAGDIWNPICTGDYVYYMDVSSDYRLCRYSMSQNAVEILTHDRVDTFNVYENVIFYQKSSQNNPQLKKMSIDGQNVSVVANGVFNSINITSTYTYFKEFGDEKRTYCTPTYGVGVSEFIEARDAVKNKK